ncbi:MAG TPA: riboflavin synthase [Croceibacterium sp.]|jgi:riboflavin synthase|nr:riboflavin synthase [Croceibacterium sp.]
MFTGIVTAVGTIESCEKRGDLRVRVACPFDPDKIAVGASIACSGVCLTVVERGGETGNAWFAVDVSAETLSRTAKDSWAEGTRINLEPSLRLGDELGGHIVSGHVDAVGTVEQVQAEGDSTRVTIVAPAALAPFVAPKGSIALDGVSLTVNQIEDRPDGSVAFGLNIIPHTAAVTTLGELGPGAEVNLEIDTLARYLKRLESLRA